MADDQDVPLSFEGGPDDRQEEDGVPVPKRKVPVAGPDVIDITSMIAGFDPASPHGKRGEQP
jgi:hypothetical protein